MLTRRFFVGCALCSIGGFAATEVLGEAPPAAATAGVTRKILKQIEGPNPGYVTVLVEAMIEPGATVARHTHPGIESSYIVEGAAELLVDGEASQRLKAGEGYQIPTAAIHSIKNGDAATKISSVYVVEKGKPLASPA